MINKLILILFLVLFYETTLLSQVTYTSDQKWQWLHPKPQGNTLRWVKMWDKNNWYMAGNFATFMKTSDAGNTWSLNYRAGSTGPTGVKNDIWDAHFFDENSGILVGGVSSVSRTTNAGSSFDSIPNVFYTGNTWHSVYFVNSLTGYITGNGKLIKTTDGGDTWSIITNISPAQNHYDVYTENDTLIIVCSSAGRIQRSSDGGLNWDNIIVTNPVNLYSLCFINKDTGFVGGSGGNILRTTNGGLNWILVNSGLPTNVINEIDYKYMANAIYVTGNIQYIYKSTNLGESWDTLGIWADNQTYMGIYHGSISTAIGEGDTLLNVGTYGLINKRNSASDRRLYTDFVKFGDAKVYDIWVDGELIWAVGAPTIVNSTFDQILYSSDGGENWVKQNVGNSQSVYYSVFMCNQSTGFTGGTQGSILKTTNGGSSWSNVPYQDTNTINKVEFVDTQNGWVFGEMGKIYKTTDSGLTWIEQNSTMSVSIQSADMVSENIGWAVGQVGYILKTTNGGNNWISQVSGVPGYITDISMLNESTGYICGQYAMLMKTTNGGENWLNVPLPLPAGVYPQTCDFIDMENGMLNDGNNSLRTTDGGLSWLIENIGTTSFRSGNGNFQINMVSPDTVYLGGSYASVLKYVSGTTIGITQWQTGIPRLFVLFQNYPNPFNPSTTIKFEIPKQSRVILKVYDITGREVRTVIDMELNAGTITHQFDGSELASGIYFYSLYIDGSRIDTKKMVLVK